VCSQEPFYAPSSLFCAFEFYNSDRENNDLRMSSQRSGLADALARVSQIRECRSECFFFAFKSLEVGPESGGDIWDFANAYEDGASRIFGRLRNGLDRLPEAAY
jgi:hypothetical protein